MASGDISYQRSRFATRLPTNRLYTASHAWLLEAEPGRWQVGFTKFATRVLGEPVEFDFEVKPGAHVNSGEIVGWIEGFKAVTDLYCPIAGRFAGPNPLLEQEISLIKSAPYDRGWLYAIEGDAPEAAFDADGYVAVLDGTIDKMLGKD